MNHWYIAIPTIIGICGATVGLLWLGFHFDSYWRNR